LFPPIDIGGYFHDFAADGVEFRHGGLVPFQQKFTRRFHGRFLTQRRKGAKAQRIKKWNFAFLGVFAPLRLCVEVFVFHGFSNNFLSARLA
jgi:hypothetical protein